MACSTLEMGVGYSLAVGLQIVAGVLSGIVSVHVVTKCGHLSFHINCKILIITMLLFYVAHSVAWTGVQAYQFYHFLTLPDLCNFGVPPYICFVARVVSMLCMISYAILQLAMVAERCFALWKCSSYEAYGMQLGLKFAIISASVIALAAAIWTLQSEIGLERKPSCFSATKSTVERISNLCSILCGINVVALIALATLYVRNKNAIRSKNYDLGTSYQLNENYSVMRLLLPLTIFQNICYAFFDIFSILLTSISQGIDASTFRILFNANYILPYFTLISPVIIWTIVRYSQRSNATRLIQITQQDRRGNDVYAYNKSWK